MDNNIHNSKNRTRREFIRDAGLVAGGLAVGAGSATFISAGSKVNALPRSSGHISQVDSGESACTGCGTCELVCAAYHESAAGCNLRRIWVEKNEATLNYRVLTCLQCDYPACYLACPLKGKALCIDPNCGTRYIAPQNCDPGCDDCIKACPLDPPRINYDPHYQKVYMCDLCKDRSGGPACVEFCPAACLELRE